MASTVKGNGATCHAAQRALKVLSLEACAGWDVLAKMSWSKLSRDRFRLFGWAATRAKVMEARCPHGCWTGRSALPGVCCGLVFWRPSSNLVTVVSLIPFWMSELASLAMSSLLRIPCLMRSTARSCNPCCRKKSHSDESEFSPMSEPLIKQVLWNDCNRNSEGGEPGTWHEKMEITWPEA